MSCKWLWQFQKALVSFILMENKNLLRSSSRLITLLFDMDFILHNYNVSKLKKTFLSLPLILKRSILNGNHNFNDYLAYFINIESERYYITYFTLYIWKLALHLFCKCSICVNLSIIDIHINASRIQMRFYLINVLF